MRYIITAAVFLLSATVANAQEPTLDDLYSKFNMRTIKSSYGQRLKYYCESYPSDYFPVSGKRIVADENILQLTAGEDSWTIKLLSPDKIGIANSITSGSYDSFTEYDIHFDNDSGEWRADETFIEIGADCVNFEE